MKEILNLDEVKELLSALGKDMKENNEMLAQLDGELGDGDMGVTVILAFRSVEKLIEKNEFSSISDLLERCAQSIGEAAPSTFGTLLSTMISCSGKALEGNDSIGPSQLAAALEAAAAGVMEKGKAKRGDKTLLDALIPAAEAAREGADNGKTLYECTVAAAGAACEGANSTIEMRAGTGRAKYLGERTIGNKDPGAAAIAIMTESVGKFILSK